MYALIIRRGSVLAFNYKQSTLLDRDKSAVSVYLVGNGILIGAYKRLVLERIFSSLDANALYLLASCYEGEIFVKNLRCIIRDFLVLSTNDYNKALHQRVSP